jgi:hypothetical protein
MALQLSYDSAFGITFPNAYAKILNFSGDSSSIVFNIAIWHDIASYEVGDRYLDIFTYTVPYDTSTAISNMYTYLKTNIQLFSTATDV